jgi:DNA modification methylase
MRHVLHEGDALDVLPTIPSGSIDAVVTDPPYPYVKRDYGTWTVEEWFAMMDRVVPECRRVLKPHGSAVFVLQPNSERVGRMRTWLWDFLAKWGREWGVVQDAYWWNYAASPEAHSIQGRLLKPSVKTCVWLGDPGCYRDQESVLVDLGEWTMKQITKTIARGRIERPSGHGYDKARMVETALRRGGSNPTNLLPVSNACGHDTAGGHGHGAGTPLELLRWWVRYLVPAGGVVLDCFAGSGTLAVAASCEGRDSVLIERVPAYCEIIRRRLSEAQGPLFAPPPAPEPPRPDSQSSLFPAQGDPAS